MVSGGAVGAVGWRRSVAPPDRSRRSSNGSSIGATARARDSDTIGGRPSGGLEIRACHSRTLDGRDRGLLFFGFPGGILWVGSTRPRPRIRRAVVRSAKSIHVLHAEAIDK